MGLAIRRASGRIRAASAVDKVLISKPKTVIDRRPPPTPPKGPVEKVIANGPPNKTPSDLVAIHPRVNLDNILEERDPKYDAMLGQMVGRIRRKPGGKPEMGEVFVVENNNRPPPKLRNTKPGSAMYEERHVPEGTLNVAQLRHVILLHEGKADDHNGTMDVHLMAEKFRVAKVEKRNVKSYQAQTFIIL